MCGSKLEGRTIVEYFMTMTIFSFLLRVLDNNKTKRALTLLIDPNYPPIIQTSPNICISTKQYRVTRHINVHTHKHTEKKENCLTLSCPGTGRVVVKIGHSNLWPGSKELMMYSYITTTVYICHTYQCIFIFSLAHSWFE